MTSVTSFEKYGAKIREQREAAGLSQQKLADAIGKTVDAVGKIERGVNGASLMTLEAIAEALGCSIRELMPGDVQPGERLPIADAQELRDAFFPEYAQQAPTPRVRRPDGARFEVLSFEEWMTPVPLSAEVACGEPMDYSVEGEMVLIPRDLAPDESKGEKLIRARGDSMIEWGIEDGDYVVVELRPGGVAARGELVVAWLNDGITLKVWDRRDGKRWLRSGNPDIPDIELTDSDVFELKAIVRRAIKNKHFPRISG